MPQVSLADRPGLCAVGHVLVPVVAAGDPVHVQHHGAVDLERADGLAVVSDGVVTATGFHGDQCGDEVGEVHSVGLLRFARWPVAPLDPRMHPGSDVAAYGRCPAPEGVSSNQGDCW